MPPALSTEKRNGFLAILHRGDLVARVYDRQAGVLHNATLDPRPYDQLGRVISELEPLLSAYQRKHPSREAAIRYVADLF